MLVVEVEEVEVDWEVPLEVPDMNFADAIHFPACPFHAKIGSSPPSPSPFSSSFTVFSISQIATTPLFPPAAINLSLPGQNSKLYMAFSPWGGFNVPVPKGEDVSKFSVGAVFATTGTGHQELRRAKRVKRIRIEWKNVSLEVGGCSHYVCHAISRDSSRVCIAHLMSTSLVDLVVVVVMAYLITALSL